MDKMTAIFAIMVVVTVMTTMWFLGGVYESMVSEQIEYETLDELDEGVELRQYREITVISTVADDSGKAFSRLAGYISGTNKENLKIRMTAPVISTRELSSVNMSFVLPAGYNMSNVPDSERSDISIHTIPSRKVAAIKFSGYANDDAVEKNRALLRSQLDEHGLVTKGDFFLMRYNPPWIPPFLMRNEVAIEVE
ncbi:heme-binding protein [Methanolobus sp. ZRKC5]|uniref:SOUL family heme-binding protein n=1 Tax=unclassified Methanolobus TaxID=2629569 RepID=UPI00313DB9D1